MKVDHKKVVNRFCVGSCVLNGLVLNALAFAFAALLSLGGGFAHATTQVYIGSVGISEGSGIAGHSFAIVQHDNKPDLQASVYHYTVRGPEGANSDIVAELLQPGRSELMVEKMERAQFYILYSGALDRVLVFHELNLTEPEAKRFEAKLQADSDNRNFTSEVKYNVYGRNCITRLIEHLNASVAKEKRIEMIEDPSTLLTSRLNPRAALSNSILNRIPYNVTRLLDRHPVSKGRVEIFERLSDTQLRFLLAMSRRLSNLVRVCKFTKATEGTVRSYLARVGKNVSGFDPVRVLKAAADACPEGNRDVGTIAMLLSRSILDEKQLSQRESLIELGLSLSGQP